MRRKSLRNIFIIAGLTTGVFATGVYAVNYLAGRVKYSNTVIEESKQEHGRKFTALQKQRPVLESMRENGQEYRPEDYNRLFSEVDQTQDRIDDLEKELEDAQKPLSQITN